MKTYTQDNFESLVAMLSQNFGLQTIEVHKHIVELYIETIPLVRVLFAEESGMLVLSFHVSTPVVEAIQIFNFAVAAFKMTALGEVYFIDVEGEVRMGQDAYAFYETAMETHFLTDTEGQSEATAEYTPHKDYPVTMVSPWAMYEASHFKAQEDFKNFQYRMQFRNGKIIT